MRKEHTVVSNRNNENAVSEAERHEEVTKIMEHYDDTNTPDSFESILENIDSKKENGSKKRSRALEFFLKDEFYRPCIRIGTGLLLMIISYIKVMPVAAAVACAVISFVLCGYKVFIYAVSSLKKVIFNEYVAILAASLAALLIKRTSEADLLLLMMELWVHIRSGLIYPLNNDDISFPDRKIGRLESLLNTIGKYFTPSMLLLALVTAFILPVFSVLPFTEWVHRAVLIAAAAPTVAAYTVVPIAYLIGRNKLIEKGIYAKSSYSIDTLTRLTSVVFDKTGTLTERALRIVNIAPVKISIDELLYLTSYAEAFSDHPIADTIRFHAGVEVDKTRIERHYEEAGKGTIVQLSTSEIITAGNYDLMKQLSVRGDYEVSGMTSVYVAVGKTYVGRIDFESDIKASAVEAIAHIRAKKVANVSLITGENSIVATRVGKALGITEIYSDCSEKDKAERIKYLVDSQESDDKLAYVCYKNKCEKALSLADVSITIDPDGKSDFSDISISDGDPMKIAEAIIVSDKVKHTAILLTVISFIIKLSIIILAYVTDFTAYFSLPITAIEMIIELFVLNYNKK